MKRFLPRERVGQASLSAKCLLHHDGTELLRAGAGGVIEVECMSDLVVHHVCAVGW